MDSYGFQPPERLPSITAVASPSSLHAPISHVRGDTVSLKPTRLIGALQPSVAFPLAHPWFRPVVSTPLKITHVTISIQGGIPSDH